jgi:hypothetical protein
LTRGVIAARLWTPQSIAFEDPWGLDGCLGQAPATTGQLVGWIEAHRVRAARGPMGVIRRMSYGERIGSPPTTAFLQERAALVSRTRCNVFTPHRRAGTQRQSKRWTPAQQRSVKNAALRPGNGYSIANTRSRSPGDGGKGIRSRQLRFIWIGTVTASFGIIGPRDARITWSWPPRHLCSPFPTPPSPI